MGMLSFFIPPNSDLVFEIELLTTSNKSGGDTEAAPITAAPKPTSPPTDQTPKTTKTTSVTSKDKDNKKPTDKKTSTTSTSTTSTTPSTSTTTTSTPSTTTNTTASNSDEKKESAWRKLNKVFRSHVDKDISTPANASSDWSTAMSEYLIFAHKLRNDKSQAPTRVLSRKGNFENLNKAFHRWVQAQKDSALDADWTPPIRDYLDHAKKLSK